MDASGASTNQQPVVAPSPQQQHPNLIRTDQVQKLPHLDQKQKLEHINVVRQLWEILNNREPQSTDYQNALMRLTQISQNLMKGMRAFQQSRQQQVQAAAAPNQQGQPGQRTQVVNPQNFSQLFPQIQQKINSIQLFPPLNIPPEQMPQWLSEARLRYGIALQKQEVGRARIAELRQQITQRQSAGNMTREEAQEFKNRQLAAERIYREGNEFLTKFREQQEAIKNQRAQQLGQAGVQNGPGQPHPQPAHTDQTAAAVTTSGGENRPTNAPVQMHPAQAPTPAAHTINSAMNAARSQATASPATSQPGQTPTAQMPAATPTAPHPQQQQPQPQPPPQQQPQPQPQPQLQQQRPQPGQGTQVPFTQGPTPSVSAPTPTAPTPTAPQPTLQPPHQQGPPRPLSHQAAMQQAAQNYSNNTTQQQNMPPAAANPHAHPQGYIQNRSSENSTRNTHMPIPKNLNVPAPEPVAMAPARPTLSGGPSHGAMGMMGQPAIQKHPGYVLEGEGQRVLSKKMLDILVRQVTGGGEGEGLTPDAEEVSTKKNKLHIHNNDPLLLPQKEYHFISFSPVLYPYFYHY